MKRTLTDQAGPGEGERACLVTLHDPGLALAFCGRLVLLNGGTVCGLLRPKQDGLAEMKEALAQIYGSVPLTRCRDRTGWEHLVMLKEREG